MRTALILLVFILQLHGSGVLGTKTYKWLTEVQELMENREYNLALDSLSKLETVVKNRPYDMAYVHQTFGYIYLEMEKPGLAIKRFESALEGEQLPRVQVLNILQNLGALYMQETRYKEAIGALERWLALAEEKKGAIYITLAIAHAQLEQNHKALAAVKAAVSLEKEPKEEWYKLLIALYYKCEDDTGMIAALKTAVELFGPKKSYLEQLFGLYMKQESYKDALAVQELIYKKGYLESEEEYRRLAMLYAYNGTPLDAAMIMESGIKSGTVAADEANLKSVYEYFVTAREPLRAIYYLSRAAELSKDGKLHLQLAQLLFEAEQYLESAKAIATALKKGGLSRPEDALMLQGVAYYEAGKTEEAKACFRKLEAFPKKRKSAESWLTYLNNLG